MHLLVNPITAFLALASILPSSCGRPFRGRRGALTAEVAPGDEWIAHAEPEVASLSPEDRAELAREWLIEARAEHASIAAFSALSLDLMAQGAPPTLVDRAHRAAIDEVVHARLCFGLASAYAGKDLSPGPFPGLRERPGPTGDEVARLAVESLQDGCLVEGFAARVAREAAQEATDPAVRATLAVIARDEARHVQLAWDVLEWCLERGAGAAVEHALRGLPQHPSLVAVASGERPALVAHGRFGRERFEEIFRETREEVIARASGYSIPLSSMSKTSVASAGILGGLPLEP
jgi:hypothetical protein